MIQADFGMTQKISDGLSISQIHIKKNPDEKKEDVARGMFLWH